MVVRLGAAICGAAVILACASAATIQSEFALVDSHAAYKAANDRSIQRNPPSKGPTIVGVASTYNPYRPGHRSGGKQTASGEPYDPSAWTAAIRTDLRERFGGVRHGESYRHAYALVQSADKHAIIKINDVGPLKPGRVIDFNQQTMRYFDPTLQRGLIHSVKVTPLLGDDWIPGPIGG